MTQESRLVIVIDSKNAERNARAVASELENLTKKGDQAETQMTAMGASIKSLVGYMGGILTINKAIAMADGYTQMAARIRNATASAEEYTMVQDRLLDTANTTYRQLGEAQEVYLSMAGGMKSLGYQTKETLDLTDSLSFSFTHNATRVDQAQSAMDALSKSMAKGKVDGDAWISIVTGADNIIADMAKTTGQTEAEIRRLGAEGKASLDDLIKTLITTREQNEKLANNMENSLADGFTKLSNEVTVYLGKANEATSATGILAGGLSSLADNLDLVANTGAALGLGYVTTALLTKGAAVKQSLVDSAARRVADQAEIQSQVQLAAVEVQRTRQITALAAQEVHLARLELNSATTRDARAAATMRLTQAEVALNIATKNTTTATAAYSAAQAAATTTSLTLAGAARSALAFMTGPVGLGITVATVAAGYLLLGNNSEKTTVSLRENNEAVNDAIQKYRELDDVQKRGQQAAEKVKLSELAEGYKELTTDLNTSAYALSRHNDFTQEQSREVNALIAEFKQTGDLDKFSAAINKLSFVSQDSKDKFNALAGQVRTSGNEYKNQKQFVDAMTNSLNQNGAAGDNAARGIRNAAEAVAEYTGKLKSQQWDLEFTNALVQKHGKSAQEADLLLQAYRENEKKGIKGVTAEQKKIISNIEAQRRSTDAYNKAQADALARQKKVAKETTSQSQKDKKETERLAKEQFDLREQIVYESAHREKQIELDLAREIAEIRKAKFNPEDTAGLIGNAEARAGYEKELYTEQLKYQLNEWQWTEEEKLDQRVKINRLLILSSRELTDANKQYSLDSMVDQSNHELGLIQLAKEQRIFQAEQAMMTEIQFMQERYRLEREEIIKTTATDLEERKRKLNALNTNTIRDGVGKNFSDPDDRGSQFLQSVDYAPISKSNSQRLDEEFEKEQAKMLANFEKVKQLNADNHEAILEAERIFLEAKQQLQDEYDFKAQDARRLDYENQLNMYGSLLSLTGGVFDELSGIVSQYKDENTKTYKTMFAFQKAAAFAQAIVSTELAAIQVMADPTALTLAQKQMHANIIRLTGYASAGIIAAQAFMGPGGDGYANGGFTGYGGKFDPAGIVHKGEVVWSQEDIKRWGGVNVVEAMRTSQPPAGYSDGGIVNPRDTYRVGMGTVEAINRNSDVQAERQAQASAKSQQSSSNGMQGLTIINQIEQDDLVGKYMRGPAGRQIILNQIKASPSEFKRAIGV
ncbi:tape measure protein [Acinetobacter johnsonii]|uniref:tape measure protein n=1 Tax=Acinetobacter johnsonii TaxID=40214 RepID=UPI0019180770|nr:tape measure protein [Acinetobacter johnsonii]QQT57148.1 tape measure protein [Acinetobacter johnsonii]